MNDTPAENTNDQLAEIESLRKTLAKKDSEIAELRGTIEHLQKSVPGALKALLDRPAEELEELPEAQRAVLQAILDLPEDAFARAESLIATLEGQPMTKAFANSLKDILRTKSWGVVCETCQKPASFGWLKNKNKRYAEGGQGFFSHSGPLQHGWMTKIRNFKFCKKLDLRRKENRQ